MRRICGITYNGVVNVFIVLNIVNILINTAMYLLFLISHEFYFKHIGRLMFQDEYYPTDVEDDDEDP